jgi:hypothetical protein
MPGLWSSLRGFFGGKNDTHLNPADFTEDVARRLRVAVPDADVQVAGELELAIDVTEDSGNRAFLNNAYQMYLSESPKYRDDVIDRFVRSFSEAAKGLERSRDAIIPVVKDRAWIAEIAESMRQMGGRPQEKIHEDINDELVVVYAIDTPRAC